MLIEDLPRLSTSSRPCKARALAVDCLAWVRSLVRLAVIIIIVMLIADDDYNDDVDDDNDRLASVSRRGLQKTKSKNLNGLNSQIWLSGHPALIFHKRHPPGSQEIDSPEHNEPILKQWYNLLSLMDHLAIGQVSSPKALFSSNKVLVIEHFSGTWPQLSLHTTWMRASLSSSWLPSSSSNSSS